MKKLLVVLAVMALASALATFAYAEEHGDFAEHMDSDEHKASQCTAESMDGAYGCWVKCGEGKIAVCEAGDNYQFGECTCHDDPHREDRESNR